MEDTLPVRPAPTTPKEELFYYGAKKAGSSYGYAQNPSPETPWELEGRAVGNELKEWMYNYQNTLSMMILTDDQPHKRNGVTIDPLIKDEHGPIPIVQYKTSKNDQQK